jgi:hypothetical protein
VIAKVQYGKGGSRTSHNTPTTSTYLGGVSVSRTSWTCSGIKACEYATKSIRDSHISWTSSDWEKKLINTHVSQQAYAEEHHIWVGQKETLKYYSLIENNVYTNSF